MGSSSTESPSASLTREVGLGWVYGRLSAVQRWDPVMYFQGRSKVCLGWLSDRFEAVLR